MDLPVVTEWFTVEDQGDDIVRLTEPHVRALIRSNVYVVTSDRHWLIVDTGVGSSRCAPIFRPCALNPLSLPLIAISIMSAGSTSSPHA